jgi:hypothetical protein
MTISEYLKNAKFVKSQITNDVDDIIRTKENEILDLNREEQIFKKGIDINGLELGIYRHNLNGNTRGYPKASGEKFNFYDTGSLFKNFNLEYSKSDNKIIFINNDIKSDMLIKKYGDFIGLTKQNQYEMNYRIIKPELMKFINQYL